MPLIGQTENDRTRLADRCEVLFLFESWFSGYNVTANLWGSDQVGDLTSKKT